MSNIFGVLCAIFGSLGLMAQTAQISGRVVDPTGAVAPGAVITLVHVETGVETASTTNSEGYFTAPSLRAPPCQHS